VCLYQYGYTLVIEHVNELAGYVTGYLKTTEATNYATQDIESKLLLAAGCVKITC
jgi:hypothetical protein